MGEDERRDGLGGETGEIGTVPGRNGRGEDAWLRAEVDGVLVVVLPNYLALTMGWCHGVVSHAEAISVVRTGEVDPQARVVGLREDGVRGRGDDVGEENGRVSTVDEETAHVYVWKMVPAPDPLFSIQVLELLRTGGKSELM